MEGAQGGKNMSKLMFEIQVPKGRDKAVWLAGYISRSLNEVMKKPITANWRVEDIE